MALGGPSCPLHHPSFTGTQPLPQGKFLRLFSPQSHNQPSSSCKFPRELLQDPGSTTGSGPPKKSLLQPFKEGPGCTPVLSRSVLSIQNNMHWIYLYLGIECGKKGKTEKDAVVKAAPESAQIVTSLVLTQNATKSHLAAS